MSRIQKRATELANRADRLITLSFRLEDGGDRDGAMHARRNALRIARKAQAVEDKMVADHRSGRRTIIPF